MIFCLLADFHVLWLFGDNAYHLKDSVSEDVQNASFLFVKREK